MTPKYIQWRVDGLVRLEWWVASAYFKPVTSPQSQLMNVVFVADNRNVNDGNFDMRSVFMTNHSIKLQIIQTHYLHLTFFLFSFVWSSHSQTVVHNTSSPVSQRNGPRGIPSGGIVITVDGTNFDVIKEPKMYVVYKGKEFSSVSKCLEQFMIWFNSLCYW